MLTIIIKKITLALSLLFSITIVYAATDLPKNCERIGYAYDAGEVVLEAMQQNPKQRLFLMKNISSYNLELKHTDKKSFMDLGWEAALDSNKWSALVIDNKDIPIQCTVLAEANNDKAMCRDVLEVCLLQKTKFALSSPGSFWLAENTTLHNVLTALRKNGIKILRS